MMGLRHLLSGFESTLLVTIGHVLRDGKLEELLEKIDRVINKDATLQKGLIGQRNQRCFAVKVCPR